jgi:hypothetical protein
MTLLPDYLRQEHEQQRELYERYKAYELTGDCPDCCMNEITTWGSPHREYLHGYEYPRNRTNWGFPMPEGEVRPPSCHVEEPPNEWTVAIDEWARLAGILLKDVTPFQLLRKLGYTV